MEETPVLQELRDVGRWSLAMGGDEHRLCHQSLPGVAGKSTESLSPWVLGYVMAVRMPHSRIGGRMTCDNEGTSRVGVWQRMDCLIVAVMTKVNNWRTRDGCTWPDVRLCVQRRLGSSTQKELAWSRQGRLPGRGAAGLSRWELAGKACAGLQVRCGGQGGGAPLHPEATPGWEQVSGQSTWFMAG